MPYSKESIRVYYCRNSEYATGISSALSALESPYVVAEPVPCSGRIDTRYLLKAFESGITAVGVVTCPKGECRLLEGNLRAALRVRAARELMAEAGLDPESLQVFTLRTGQDSPETITEAVLSFVRARLAQDEVKAR